MVASFGSGKVRLEIDKKGKGQIVVPFSSADELRKELIRQGATDSFVVPYINGRRVTKDDSKVYSAAYPDLLNYLNESD